MYRELIAAPWENSNLIYFEFFNYCFLSVLVYFGPFLLYFWSREPYNHVDGYAGIQIPQIKSKFDQVNVTKQRFPRFYKFSSNFPLIFKKMREEIWSRVHWFSGRELDSEAFSGRFKFLANLTFFDHRRPGKRLKIMKGLLKNEVLEFAAHNFAQPAAASGNGNRPAVQTHPSTRAGDQDDVSSKQTPSNYNVCCPFQWEKMVPKVLIRALRDHFGTFFGNCVPKSTLFRQTFFEKVDCPWELGPSH